MLETRYVGQHVATSSQPTHSSKNYTARHTSFLKNKSIAGHKFRNMEPIFSPYLSSRRGSRMFSQKRRVSQTDRNPSPTKQHKHSRSLDEIHYGPIDEHSGSFSMSHSFYHHRSSSADLAEDMLSRGNIRVPSEDEAKYTFCALPSKPTLLATSRETPWPYSDWDLDLRTAERHDGVTKQWYYGSPMVSTISKTLDSCEIPWEAMEILGYGGILRAWSKADTACTPQDPPAPQIPIVMIISVENTEFKIQCAYSALADIRQSLANFDIKIPVDIKTSKLVQSSNRSTDLPPSGLGSDDETPSSTTIFKHTIDQPSDINYSDYLGARIANQRSAHSGSNGLYLTTIATPEHLIPQVVQLTCKHVAHPSKEFPKNEDHLRNSDNQHAHAMEQPPLNEVLTEEASARQTVNEVQDEFKGLDNARTKLYIDEEANHEEIEFLSKQIKLVKDSIAELEPKLEYLSKLCQNSQDRKYGTIICAPKLESYQDMDDSKPHVRDWALIALDRNKYASWPPKNRVFISNTDKDINCFKSELQPPEQRQARNFLRRAQAGDKTVSLKGSIDDAELDAIFAEKKNNNRLLVGKVGPTTGFTLGFINGYKSIKRNPLDTELSSWEWCIVLVANGLSVPVERKDRFAFSADSDSGSSVWTLDGRIVGMLTSGLKEEGGSDVTYMTSIQQLQKDMAGFGCPTQPL